MDVNILQSPAVGERRKQLMELLVSQHKEKERKKLEAKKQQAAERAKFPIWDRDAEWLNKKKLKLEKLAAEKDAKEYEEFSHHPVINERSKALAERVKDKLISSQIANSVNADKKRDGSPPPGDKFKKAFNEGEVKDDAWLLRSFVASEGTEQTPPPPESRPRPQLKQVNPPSPANNAERPVSSRSSQPRMRSRGAEFSSPTSSRQKSPSSYNTRFADNTLDKELMEYIATAAVKSVRGKGVDKNDIIHAIHLAARGKGRQSVITSKQMEELLRLAFAQLAVDDSAPPPPNSPPPPHVRSRSGSPSSTRSPSASHNTSINGSLTSRSVHFYDSVVGTSIADNQESLDGSGVEQEREEFNESSILETEAALHSAREEVVRTLADLRAVTQQLHSTEKDKTEALLARAAAQAEVESIRAELDAVRAEMSTVREAVSSEEQSDREKLAEMRSKVQLLESELSQLRTRSAETISKISATRDAELVDLRALYASETAGLRALVGVALTRAAKELNLDYDPARDPDFTIASLDVAEGAESNKDSNCVSMTQILDALLERYHTLKNEKESAEVENLNVKIKLEELEESRSELIAARDAVSAQLDKENDELRQVMAETGAAKDALEAELQSLAETRDAFEKERAVFLARENVLVQALREYRIPVPHNLPPLPSSLLAAGIINNIVPFSNSAPVSKNDPIQAPISNQSSLSGRVSPNNRAQQFLTSNRPIATSYRHNASQDSAIEAFLAGSNTPVAASPAASQSYIAAAAASMILSGNASYSTNFTPSKSTQSMLAKQLFSPTAAAPESTTSNSKIVSPSRRPPPVPHST